MKNNKIIIIVVSLVIAIVNLGNIEAANNYTCGADCAGGRAFTGGGLLGGFLGANLIGGFYDGYGPYYGSYYGPYYYSNYPYYYSPPYFY